MAAAVPGSPPVASGRAKLELVPQYNVLCHHTIETGDQELVAGDAFRYEGVVWRVEMVKPAREDGGAPIVLFRRWPAEMRHLAEVKGAPY